MPADRYLLQRFRPITVERPNVLLPLVNAPLLDYTLEWLASNEVEEVFLFCCSNADKIQEYVNSTKWGSIPGFDVKVVVSTNCFSAGEAMRLIDQQDVIKGARAPAATVVAHALPDAPAVCSPEYTAAECQGGAPHPPR